MASDPCPSPGAAAGPAPRPADMEGAYPTPVPRPEMAMAAIPIRDPPRSRVPMVKPYWAVIRDPVPTGVIAAAIPAAAATAAPTTRPTRHDPRPITMGAATTVTTATLPAHDHPLWQHGVPLRQAWSPVRWSARQRPLQQLPPPPTWQPHRRTYPTPREFTLFDPGRRRHPRRVVSTPAPRGRGRNPGALPLGSTISPLPAGFPEPQCRGASSTIRAGQTGFS